MGRTKCEVFSRSMGFIRPVSNFNIGKYSEFCERNLFKEEKCLSTGQRHQDSL
jgi:anaerobic ribonucleoside-triphosphate reductase